MRSPAPATFTFSPLTAGRVVGTDYVERKGLAGVGDPVGEMDDMVAYARPGFDPDALHPEGRRFYERTSEFAMADDFSRSGTRPARWI